MIPKQLLKFLIICFWINISLIPTLIIYMIVSLPDIFVFGKGLDFESYPFAMVLINMSTIPFFILFIYTVYFYFKYDKYSKAGIYLFLFNWVYALIYFYKVIWKRKRELVNSYEHEPVIGVKIFIESEELDGAEKHV